MSRKIKYALKTNFNYSHVSIEIESVDGDVIAPEELADLLASALDDYSELDLGSEVH